MITIKNLKTDTFTTAPTDIKVDRTSVLGNPFFMKSEEERYEVCAKYATYFTEQLKTNPKFTTELDRIYDILLEHKNISLFCHCAPKRCHAQTIRLYLMRKYFITQIGKDIRARYPFGRQIQFWDMRNFTYDPDTDTIKHNRLPLIIESFIHGVTDFVIDQSATHG